MELKEFRGQYYVGLSKCSDSSNEVIRNRFNIPLAQLEAVKSAGPNFRRNAQVDVGKTHIRIFCMVNFISELGKNAQVGVGKTHIRIFCMVNFISELGKNAQVGVGKLTFEFFVCYTRAFGDGPRNFEPWSSDVDDTRAGTPSPNYHTTPTEDVSALDRLNVHRCPTRRVFSGSELELVTRQATVRYLYHSATAATGSFGEKSA
ncbi:hypothetical protein TNCV_4118921 [Trichonephila clavipes]|nr:hypothetical protein TNCV_4118921 [Trichonephila clavipes]